MRHFAAAVVATLLVQVPAPTAATEQLWLIPPVDGSVAYRFEAPSGPYGPGHRGVDYVVARGTRVRAAGAGTVTFSGSIGRDLFVTIAHPGGIETTYSQLAEAWVRRGQSVDEGTWLGLSGESHPGETGLHLGVKVDGAYVDPETMLGATDVTNAIHLAPLVWEPSTDLPEALRSAFMPTSAGSAERRCEAWMPRARGVRQPNRNIAVAVAGIGSRTLGGTHADMYEYGPDLLGYSKERVYEYSYAGASNRRLHEPYPATATFDDLDTAAERLKELMREIARRHPGKRVDLIAHSQGGIVARTYLALAAHAYERGLPPVEHLVTFSSPHTGAPAAGEVDGFQRRVSGRSALAIASLWARNGGPLPDPFAVAVGQLAPASDHTRRLAQEDVLFGTRVLTLGIPNDVVVPADRTAIPGELRRFVPPAGLNGHSAIVDSPYARGIAYDFLRGAPASCRSGWDTWGPRIGGVVSRAESLLAEGLGVAEAIGLRVPGPLP